ncbi:MAG: hypothetical protein K2V38_01585 [Gemmataceae bacterium]|nr:hypothetical protein [Gemmataceae bacterium]
MNRAEFQQLADVRIKEAETLLTAGLWDGAYYLAGYAVECGLKACILARVERDGAIFEDKKFSEKCWTHRLDELVALAALEAERAAEAAANANFDTLWRRALLWKEDARYKRITETEAKDLCQAVTDSTDGVMRWIRKYW